MNDSSGVEAYVLGREYTVMPIAIDWSHCREIPAGPVTFVVEARALTQEAIVENERLRGTTDGLVHDYELDEFGASLHVLGSDDRLEYLRFDCFDDEPHYHYIRNDEQRNVVVRFDQFAEGDPLEWTVATVAERLPEMLEHVGADDLAEAVRADRPAVERGVEDLRETLLEAARSAADLRARRPGAGVVSSATSAHGGDDPPRAVEVLPLSQHTGAEIRGVDLASDLDDETVAAIRAALLQWKVIFFRNQQLSRDAHVAFGARFGEVLPGHPTLPAPFPERPEVLVIEKEHQDDTSEEGLLEHYWHSDVTFVEAPPLGSILRAVAVPPYGGDTEWTNLAAAYASLSEPLRSLADGLHAVHHNVLHLVRGEPTALMRSFEARRLRAVHPVVAVHPETGERVLYVNPDYASHIVELTRRESVHVLACLNEHLTSREFTVRFRWEPGCVAFWDNRSSAHIAPADVPPGSQRVMERITLAGTRPVGVDGFVSYALDGPEDAGAP